MATGAQSKLKLRSLIPPFQLMGTDGRTVNIWDFKGLHNMALVFVPEEPCPACEEFLRSVVDSLHRYRDEKTVVLPVLRGGAQAARRLQDDLDLPFPILFDETGAVTRQYTDTLPAVFVTDLFGELRAQWIVGPEGGFPSQREIIDTVELINLECPECGAPLEWP